jgi:hypothetical protein
VYDYVGGKIDWMAAGLAIEGAGASIRRAADLAYSDVPTARMHERTHDVARRARDASWDIAVVVSADRTILGLLDAEALARDAGVGEAMRAGPSTWRPYVPALELKQKIAKNPVDNILISTGEGQLVGVVKAADLAEVPGEFAGKDDRPWKD